MATVVLLDLILLLITKKFRGGLSVTIVEGMKPGGNKQDFEKKWPELCVVHLLYQYKVWKNWSLNDINSISNSIASDNGNHLEFY